jgi:hypothetical protein
MKELMMGDERPDKETVEEKAVEEKDSAGGGILRPPHFEEKAYRQHNTRCRSTRRGEGRLQHQFL